MSEREDVLSERERGGVEVVPRVVPRVVPHHKDKSQNEIHYRDGSKGGVEGCKDAKQKVHVERQLIPSRLNEIKCVEEFRPGGFHKLDFGSSSIW